MKKLLVDLIKIDSVSSNVEKLNIIVDYVEKYFDWTGAIIERYTFNDKPSIIIKNFEWKKADIILNWHLDVVPPSEENQFEPYEKDGKLFARWAGDMKAGVVIIMKLMKDLLLEKFFKKKVSLILTTDEEVGWFDGVAKIVEKWYSADIVLIPDGGNIDKVVYSEKGIIQLDMEFYWKSSHSSRPWLGENAITNAINFYSFIKSYIQDDKKLFLTKDHWWSSVNLNYLNAWIATNVIPDKARAKIDIRFTEEFNLDKLLNFVYDGIKQFNWKILNTITWSVLHSDPSNKYIRKYLENAKKYVPDVVLDKEHWASDGRFFSEKWAVVLLHRPACANLHWKGEYVVLKDLEVIYNIYKDFILN